jgi:hypothetical protein
MMTQKPTDQYYVSLDDHIDLERLQALDGVLRRTLEEIHALPGRPASLFVAGERLDPAAPTKAGSKTVYLQRQTSGGYYQIHDAACWERSDSSDDFPELMDFIQTLPFERFGRAFIIYDFDGFEEPVHRDHGDPDLTQEFMWLRPNLTKRFYIYDKRQKEKHFVASHSAWFDTRHFHGTDPSPGLSLSIRVDGVFRESLRSVIREQQGLVPPRDLTVLEKTRKRLMALGQNMEKFNLRFG